MFNKTITHYILQNSFIFMPSISNIAVLYIKIGMTFYKYSLYKLNFNNKISVFAKKI